MNKNSLTAMVLILAVISIFTWIEKPKNNIDDKKVEINSDKKVQNPNDSIVNTDKKDSITIKNKTVIQNETEKEIIQNRVEDTVWVETDKIIAGISEKGARIISIKMKDYNYSFGENEKNKVQIVDLISENSQGAAQLKIDGNEYDNEMFEYVSDKDGIIKVLKNDKVSLKFKYNDLIKEFVFEDGSYNISLNVIKDNLSGKRVRIGWLAGINESELDSTKHYTENKRVHYYDGQNVQHIEMKKIATEELNGSYKWIGITSKYFFVSLVSDNSDNNDIAIKAFKISNEKKNNLNYSISTERTAENNKESFLIYAGPSKYKELKNSDMKFEKILFPVMNFMKHFLWADSWFPWIAEIVLRFLLWLNTLVKDYGIAIILITIISRIVTYPMTASSTKSMSKMKDLSPKINALRQRYKNNPQKMNEELMALYKAEGVNPLNPGCLPIFLQMPIFFALFVVLQKAIELRGASTILIPWVSDLSKPEVLFSLKSILPGGIPMYGSNVALMPILMAVLQFFQNKMTITDPNQKAMIYLMPVIFLIMFNNLPAGLGLYWVFSSAIGIIQQIITNKSKKAVTVTVPAKRK